MIERTERDGVTVLRLEHGKAHALDLELCRALTAELSEARAAGVPAVLTGSGGIFSAGVDLVRLLREPVDDYTPPFLEALAVCFRTLFEHPAPVVAAINGHAVAGGCILALACDRRIAAEGDYGIGVPELRVGVPFPVVALEILRHALPGQVGDGLVYEGEVVPPAEALERRMIDALAPPGELLDRAVAAARRLGAIPAASFTATKWALRAPAFERYRAAAPTADPETIASWSSPEVRAAVAAHVERTLGKRS